MRVHGGAARQAAQQRDDGEAVQRAARHGLDREAQRAAPADAHRHAVLQALGQGGAGGRGDDLRDQRLVGRRGHDGRILEAVLLLELLLERDAVGEAAGDVDLHEALVAGLGQQAVDAGAVEAELLADLRLGEARHEIEPGGARGELLLGIDCR